MTLTAPTPPAAVATANAIDSPDAPTAAWSELEIAHVRGASRVVTSRSQQPLKLLNPAAAAGCCHVVVSSYGGGLVAGDVLGLHLAVGAGARLLLSTQANTKVYKSVDGAVAEQHTTGTLAAGALAVVFPDPVVPQAGSRYRQTHDWTLAPDAVLLLIDWIHGGRTDQGERFVFTDFQSEVRVHRAGRLVLLDRFAFAPADHAATAPAHFGPYQTAFTAYLVGDPAEARYARLAAHLHAQTMPERAEPHFSLRDRPAVVAVTAARPGVTVLRAGALDRLALQPLCDALLQELAAPELLGDNPLRRKH